MTGDSALRRAVFAAFVLGLFAQPASALSKRCTAAANAFNHVSARIKTHCVGRGYQPQCAPTYRSVVRHAKSAVRICQAELTPAEISGMQAFIARGEQILAADAVHRRAARPHRPGRAGAKPQAPSPPPAAGAPTFERDPRLPVRVVPGGQ
jgi:hypothetical protein